MKKKTTKKKRKPRKRRATNASSRGPFFVRHPLQDVDLDVRRQYVAAAADAATTHFQEHLNRLVALSSDVSPLHVLAILASYSLMGSIEKATKRRKRPFEIDRVQQGHVEYMQALFLRQALVRHDPPRPDVMQEIFDLLPALFEAHGQMRVPSSAEGSDDTAAGVEKMAAEAVQWFLQSHTAVVRNWGYFTAVKRIAGEVLGAADAEFRGVYGLTLTQLVLLFEHLLRRAEDRVNDFRKRMFNVFRAGSPAAMGLELAKQFADFEGTDELRDLLCEAGMQQDEAKFRVLVALEGILPSYMLFDAETIAQELRLAVPATSNLLKRLSLSFGDLHDMAPDALVLNNPIWLQPLIEVQEGIFFSALPQTLMSFVFPIVERLVKPHDVLREKLQRARAKYLEDATERLLRTAFPGCTLVRGYQWMEGDRQYESDLALRYDATILLIESKSGGVSWPALRGAPQRMVRQIQDLIVAPSDQSARLAERLKEAISGTPGPVADFPLPLEGVWAISRLSVTLHDFATVQSIPHLLLDAGLIKSEHRLAPCLTLADLEVVIDILDTPYLRMHYLRRRAELLTNAAVFGDELDSLGMYLDTGFNIGEAEVGSLQLTMIGYSARLDRHYAHVDEGLAARKPKVNITPWIRALCDQLMKRAAPGWYEIAHALLSLDHKDQHHIEREMRSRMKRMRTGKPAKDGLDSVVFVPPAHRRMALVFYMRPPDDSRTARDTAGDLASHVFEVPHVEVCAVLGFGAQMEDLSYHSAGLLYRTDRPVEARTYL